MGLSLVARLGQRRSRGETLVSGGRCRDSGGWTGAILYQREGVPSWAPERTAQPCQAPASTLESTPALLLPKEQSPCTHPASAPLHSHTHSPTPVLFVWVQLPDGTRQDPQRRLLSGLGGVPGLGRVWGDPTVCCSPHTASLGLLTLLTTAP